MNLKPLLFLLAAAFLAALPLSAARSEAPGGVTFSGKVVFDGKDIPKMMELDMSSKPEHAAHCMANPDRLDRSYQVDPETKGIANVFVEIRKVTKDDWKVDKPVEVDQMGCRFEPHVMVIPAGAEVQFKNSDPFMHNVNLTCRKNTGGNFGIPEAGEKDVNFKYAEKVKVSCDVHTWMSSWLVVTDNPYHALTGKDGSFTIPDVPPGTYEVRFWHETLGELRKKDVEIADGKMVEIKSSDADWKA